jgi:death-on-curing protein
MDIKDPSIIIRLHDELITEFGGEPGLISKNLLYSSLSRPFFGLSDGTELYRTIEDKAAALIHSLIKNHPFVDGNKRTAAHVTKIFLRENNYDWVFTNDEIVEFVLDIANSRVDLDYIKKWIAERIIIIE